MAKNTRKDDAVIVIGLGRFGGAVAQTLTGLGRDVLAVDTDMQLVQHWSEVVTHAVQADVTNPDAMGQIGAADFSTAVVAVGSSIEASVLITANLVDAGVPEIWAKAVSASHGRILERIGASHVVFPEADSGERVAHLLSGQLLDFLEVDRDFVIVKMTPPRQLQGTTLGETGLRRQHKVTVVGVKAPNASFTYATAETPIEADDIILVSGHPDDVEKFAALPK